MDPVQETFGEQLKEMCRDRFKGIPAFAEKYDIRPQTLYSELSKEPVVLSSKALMAFALEFGLDPFALEKGRFVSHEREPVNVPLVGSIAAGQPVEMLETSDSHSIPAELADQYPRAFLLHVKGESMNKILPNGCYALVDPCSEVADSGKPYVVAVDESEATVKRVRLLNNGIELVPDSTDPTFKPQLFDFDVDSFESVRVIGRVVWYCLPADWQL